MQQPEKTITIPLGRIPWEWMDHCARSENPMSYGDFIQNESEELYSKHGKELETCPHCGQEID